MRKKALKKRFHFFTIYIYLYHLKKNIQKLQLIIYICLDSTNIYIYINLGNLIFLLN